MPPSLPTGCRSVVDPRSIAPPPIRFQFQCVWAPPPLTVQISLPSHRHFTTGGPVGNSPSSLLPSGPLRSLLLCRQFRTFLHFFLSHLVASHCPPALADCPLGLGRSLVALNLKVLVSSFSIISSIRLTTIRFSGCVEPQPPLFFIFFLVCWTLSCGHHWCPSTGSRQTKPITEPLSSADASAFFQVPND